jgi:predicted branched-subunit amino acid permease
MPTPRSEFIAGVKALLPILLGVIPFGMISGIAVVQTHIPPVSGFIMSLLIFSGAALIVALQLITSGAPALVVVFSALVINLRFMIYSASLAPFLNRLSAGRKSLLAYLLSDQAYAASIAHMSESPAPEATWLHFLGSGLTMWVAWQISVGIGMFVGARLPASWSLEFTIPLTFLALAVPAIKDRFTAATAVIAGITAVVANGAPFHSGLVIAALVGILVGMLLERRAA